MPDSIDLGELGVFTDPIKALSALLEHVGVRPTFDGAANITHPCCLCGTTGEPRDLIIVGRYTRRMGGNLQPGDAIRRPMCAACVAATELPAL